VGSHVPNLTCGHHSPPHFLGCDPLRGFDKADRQAMIQQCILPRASAQKSRQAQEGEKETDQPTVMHASSHERGECRNGLQRVCCNSMPRMRAMLSVFRPESRRRLICHREGGRAACPVMHTRCIQELTGATCQHCADHACGVPRLDAWCGDGDWCGLKVMAGATGSCRLRGASERGGNSLPYGGMMAQAEGPEGRGERE